MDINGSHVLITGASRGIGAALARAFAAGGARVSLVARSTNAIETLAGELGGRAFTADLLDPQVTEELIARVEAEAGPIDVLVNNAGIEGLDWAHEITVDQARNVVRLNLETPIVLTRQVINGMIERGRGHVVFLSSLAGTGGFPGLATYGATKAGLTNYAAALRMELAGSGVGTTVVAPGPVDTEMWDTIEASSEMDPMLKRLRQMQLIPTKSPQSLARKTVKAVQADRRHVRVPRRLSLQHWLRETPTRMTENLLRGVPVGVGAKKV